MVRLRDQDTVQLAQERFGAISTEIASAVWLKEVVMALRTLRRTASPTVVEEVDEFMAYYELTDLYDSKKGA